MGNRIPFRVIRRKVRKLLSDCGIDLDSIDFTDISRAPIDLDEIANCRNINIRYHAFSNDISGVFYKKDGKLFLGVNDNQPENRQRFTMAHEIGHHILHADDILHCDEIKIDEIDKVYYRSEIQSTEETEANFFAAELLMPEELVDRCIEDEIETVEELAEHFHVSEDAMRYRLINLGYL